MHTFNNMVNITSDRYNDPDRGIFYQQNKFLLWMQTGLSGLASLIMAVWMSPHMVVLVICMSFTGIVYIISLVPESIRSGIPPKIRNIPGSKTILVSLAWGIVTAIVPALQSSGTMRLSTLIVFFWSASLVFIRTAFFDILDIQGSRIAGKETIPILLGEKRTMRLLKLMSVLTIIVISLAGLTRLVSPLGIALGLCPLSILFFLFGYERAGFSPGLRQVLMMESHFVLAGLIAVLWSTF